MAIEDKEPENNIPEELLETLLKYLVTARNSTLAYNFLNEYPEIVSQESLELFDYIIELTAIEKGEDKAIELFKSMMNQLLFLKLAIEDGIEYAFKESLRQEQLAETVRKYLSAYFVLRAKQERDLRALRLIKESGSYLEEWLEEISPSWDGLKQFTHNNPELLDLQADKQLEELGEIYKDNAPVRSQVQACRFLLRLCGEFGVDYAFAPLCNSELGIATLDLMGVASPDELAKTVNLLGSEEGFALVRNMVEKANQMSKETELLLDLEERYRIYSLGRATSLVFRSVLELKTGEELLAVLNSNPMAISSEAIIRWEEVLLENTHDETFITIAKIILDLAKALNSPEERGNAVAANVVRYLMECEPIPQTHELNKVFLGFILDSSIESQKSLILRFPELLDFPAALYQGFLDKLKRYPPLNEPYTFYHLCEVLGHIEFLLDAQVQGVEKASEIAGEKINNLADLQYDVAGFMRSDSMWRAKDVLRTKPHLLTRAALQSISSFAAGAYIEGDILNAYRFIYFFELLQECLESGVERAFEIHNLRIIDKYRRSRLQANSSDERGAILYILGRAYAGENREEEALTIFRSASGYFDPTRYPEEANEIALHFGKILMNKEDNRQEAMFVLTIALIAAEILFFRANGQLEDINEALSQELFLLTTCFYWMPVGHETLFACIDAARSAEARYTLSILLHEQARRYANEDEIEKAIPFFIESAAYSRDVSRYDALLITLFSLAKAKQHLKQYDDLKEIIEEARRLAIQLGETELEVDLVLEMGLLLQGLHDLDLAEETLLDVFTRYKALGLYPGMVASATALGNVYMGKDLYQEATAWHSVASEYMGIFPPNNKEDELKFPSQKRHHPGYAPEFIIISAANAMYSRGHYQEAIDLYQEAIRTVNASYYIRPIEALMPLCSIYNGLGGVYGTLGQHQLAIDSFQEALKIAQYIQNKDSEIASLNNLGISYFMKGDTETAIEYLDLARNTIKDVGGERHLAGTLTQLANIYHYTGEIEKAFSLQEEARSLASSAGDRGTELAALMNLAQYYEHLTEYERAHELLLDSLFIAKESGDKHNISRCLLSLANICYEQGKKEEAFHYQLDFLETTESMRYPLISSFHRSGISNYSHGFFEDAVQLGIQTENVREALRIAELGRTRWLSDQLYRRNWLPKSHPLYRDYVQALDDIDIAYSSTMNLAEGWKTLAIPEFISDIKPPTIEDAWEKLNNVLERINDEGEHHQIKHGISFDDISLAHILNSLPKNTALLEFVVCHQGTFVFLCVYGREVEVIHIPELTEDYLGIVIGGRYGTLTAGVWTSAYKHKQQKLLVWFDTIKSVLNEIGEVLLPPLLASLDNIQVDNILVVPHGPLFLIPIHALTINNEYPLLASYSTAYTPSVMLSIALNDSQIEQPSSYSIFGNLTGDLPFASCEAFAIENLIQAPINSFIGDMAVSKTEFFAVAENATCIHFAGHGVYEWNDPPQSGILLSNEEKITVSEFRHHLNLSKVQLFTISACETNIVDAEGANANEYFGLPGAIILSGAQAVVGTLWPVNDASTMLLMKRFYEELLQGGSVDRATPSEALRNAQLWLLSATREEILSEYDNQMHLLYARGLISDARIIRKVMAYIHKDKKHKPYEHPYFWAGFQAVGKVL